MAEQNTPQNQATTPVYVQGTQFSGSVGTPFTIPGNTAIFVSPSNSNVLDYNATRAAIMAEQGYDPLGQVQPNPNAVQGSADYEMSRTYYSAHPSARFQEIQQQYYQQHYAAELSKASFQPYNTPETLAMVGQRAIDLGMATQSGNISRENLQYNLSLMARQYSVAPSSLVSLAATGSNYIANVAAQETAQRAGNGLMVLPTPFVSNAPPTYIPGSLVISPLAGEIPVMISPVLKAQVAEYLWPTPQTVTLIGPFGSVHEIEKAKVALDPLTGEISAWTGNYHGTWGLIGGVGRFGAQSGEFSVLDTSGNKLNLATLSPLWTENIPKSQAPGADIPWTVPASAPAFSAMNEKGLGAAISIPTAKTFVMPMQVNAEMVTTVQKGGVGSELLPGVFTVPGMASVMSESGGIPVVPGSYKLESTIIPAEPTVFNFASNLFSNFVSAATMEVINLPATRGFSETITKESYVASLPAPFVSNAPVGYSPQRVLLNVSTISATTEPSYYQTINSKISSAIPALPEDVGNRYANDNSAFGYATAFGIGAYKGVQEHPLDVVKFASESVLFMAGARSIGVGVTALASGTRAAPVVVTAKKAIPFILGGLYSESVAERSTSRFTDISPNAAEKFGEIISSETLPILAGGMAYSMLSLPKTGEYVTSGNKPSQKGMNIFGTPEGEFGYMAPQGEYVIPTETPKISVGTSKEISAPFSDIVALRNGEIISPMPEDMILQFPTETRMVFGGSVTMSFPTPALKGENPNIPVIDLRVRLTNEGKLSAPEGSILRISESSYGMREKLSGASNLISYIFEQEFPRTSFTIDYVRMQTFPDVVSTMAGLEGTKPVGITRSPRPYDFDFSEKLRGEIKNRFGYDTEAKGYGNEQLLQRKPIEVRSISPESEMYNQAMFKLYMREGGVATISRFSRSEKPQSYPVSLYSFIGSERIQKETSQMAIGIPQVISMRLSQVQTNQNNQDHILGGFPNRFLKFGTVPDELFNPLKQPDRENKRNILPILGINQNSMPVLRQETPLDTKRMPIQTTTPDIITPPIPPTASPPMYPKTPIPPPFVPVFSGLPSLPAAGGSGSGYGRRGISSRTSTNPVGADLLGLSRKMNFKPPGSTKFKRMKFNLPKF